MSKNFAQVNATADTFQTLVDRVNDLVRTLGLETVTANSSSDGALTTGNTYVAGILGGLTLTANTIRGGYPNIAAPLNVGSNLNINTSFSINAGNSKVNATSITVGANTLINTTAFAVTDATGGNAVHISTGFLIGNAFVNGTAVMVGNSSVFSQVNSTSVYTQNTSSSTLVTPASIKIGNSVVNTTITSAGIPSGGIQSIGFGDATANLTANVSGVFIANTMGMANLTPLSLTVGPSYINATGLGVGANVVVDLTSLRITAASANVIVSINGISVGNSTANAIVNTTIIQAANSLGVGLVSPGTLQTGNSTQTGILTGVALSLGNSTVNSTMNTSSITVTKIIFKDGSSQQGGGFAAGTRLFFPQATLPIGWTLESGQHDRGIRIVNTTGGTMWNNGYGYSGVFTSRAWYTDLMTLSEGHMPPHSHNFSGYYCKITQGEGAQVGPDAGYSFWTESGILPNTNNAGGGAAHQHYNQIFMGVQTTDTLIGIKA